MTIQEAVEKAREGGWLSEADEFEYLEHSKLIKYRKRGLYYRLSLYQALFYPSFWQCLGKAMGWEQRVKIHYSGFDDGKMIEMSRVPYYVYEWHCLVDWLAEGKSIEDYFKDLN